MKSQIKIIVLLLCCCLYGTLSGKPKTTYKMSITQNSISSFSVKLDITLQGNYCSNDTVFINLGGQFFEEEGETFSAVSNLTVKSKQNIPFIFDKENSKIKICKKDIKNNKISLEYGFTFIWGTGINCTDFGTLFYNNTADDNPLPVVQNIDSVYFSAQIKTLKNFICLSNNNDKYTDINQIALCFIDTTHLIQKHFDTKFCKTNIFANDTTLTDTFLNELGRKTGDCLNYFATNISPCRFKEFNVIEWPNFWGSTCIGGIACVKESAFKTYTVFHEITHEWIDGQVITKDGSKGEYLTKESLNEYLMTQFLRYEEGDSLYQVQIKNYTDNYDKYLSKNEDKSIWNITKYVTSTHPIIMYKQVILLDELAQKVGYDKLNSVIFDFLKRTMGQKIEATQFLNVLKENFGQPAIDYCEKI